MGRRPAKIRDANPAMTCADAIARRRRACRKLAGTAIFGATILAELAAVDHGNHATRFFAAPPPAGTSVSIKQAARPSLAPAGRLHPILHLTKLKALTKPGVLAHHATAAAPQAAPATARSRAMQMYAALPMSFEANAGQSDPRVKFLARAPSYTLFLTNREVVLSLPAGSSVPASLPPGTSFERTPNDRYDEPSATREQARAVRIRFLGAGTPSVIAGRNQLPGKTNYFIGNDPKLWHTNVPNYSSVEYGGLFPGVDAVFHGDNRRLEFDFDISPGADPGAIMLQIEGARRVRLNPAGDLLLDADAYRGVTIGKPDIYQQSPTGRREIAGHYVLTAGNQIAFALGPYDHAQPLVIDPTVSYVTYLGGSTEDSPYAVAADSSGDAYIAGQTFSANYPVTTGAYQTSCLVTGETSCTPGMAFVTELGPDGSSLVYSTFINDHSGSDGAYGVAVDSSGSAYVLGAEKGEADFPTIAGAYQPTCNGGGSQGVQIFVAKLNPTGSKLDYSTCVMNSTPDAGNQFSTTDSYPGGIAVDANGDAYVTGETDFPTDFPTTQGTFRPNCVVQSNGECTVILDPFVIELNPTGTSLLYSTFLSYGGSASEITASGIAVDPLGNAYVVGSVESEDEALSTGLITVPGSYAPSCPSGGCGGFIAKLNGNASALIYSTFLANVSDYATPNAVAVNQNGEAYVAGVTVSTDFPTTPGVLQSSFTPPGSSTTNIEDGFVIEVGATGASYEYSTFLGGTAYDTIVTGIAVDAEGHAFVTGVTDSGFPTTADALQTTDGAGANQAFFAELDMNGASLLYSTYLAGTNGETYDTEPSVTGVSYIATDPNGAAYIIGQTSSSDFPTTTGAYQMHSPLSSGSSAATGFVAKFNFPQPVDLSISPTTVPSGTVGVAYSPIDFFATGGTGTVTFAVTVGNTPPGLTLEPDGTLSGTPSDTGTFPFTITATDANNDTGSQAYSLVIACQAITVSPSTLASGTSGMAYGPVTFTEAGGIGTTTFSEMGALPTGITFAEPVLGGTTTQTGSFPFQVIATDSNSCTGSVSPTLTINSASGQPAQVTDNETITVSDGETFPDVVDAESIKVTDSEVVTAYNAITITPSPATFNASDGNGYATYAYSVPFAAAGGIGTLSLTESGALPTGITFVNGLLSGTPAASSVGNTYMFSVTATDADGDSVTVQGYSLSIQAASAYPAMVMDSETITVSDAETLPDVVDSEPITVTDMVSVTTNLIITSPSSLPAGNLNVAYPAATILAGGGSGIYTWSTTGLPPGLSIGSSTGTITGTPTADTGSPYFVTVTVTDSNGLTATKTYSLTVTPPAPIANLNPTSLAFSAQTSGTQSAAQTVTLSNTGSAPLSLSGTGLGISISGANATDFAQSSPSCGTSVAAGANCAINVTFTPSLSAGSETAMLNVADNAGGSPQQVQLSGIALPPASVSCTIPTISLSGDSGTATITCTATDFTGTIALDCNLPTSLSKYVSCSFSPSSLNFGSSSTASTTLTIQAVKDTSASLERRSRPWAAPTGGVALGAVLWLPASALVMRRKKGRSKRGLLLMLILLCGLPMISSCGGKTGPPTPPAGTYQGSMVLTGPGLNETINFAIQVK